MDSRERNLEMAREWLHKEGVYLDNEPSVHVKGGYYADLTDLLARFYEHMAGE